MGEVKYTWKDLVYIDGKVFAEEVQISGERDDDTYNCDNFFSAIEKKYGRDDFTTYMFDGENFAPAYDTSTLPYGVESCGLYVNDIPSWYIPDELLNLPDEELAELIAINENILNAESVIICDGDNETVHNNKDYSDKIRLSSGKIIYVQGVKCDVH